MSWVELFQLMSWKPATAFSDALPGLKNKGVIRVGADADIIVVDPHIIEDWGTYQHPNQPSKGIVHVIVNGKWVLRSGKLFPKTREAFFY